MEDEKLQRQATAARKALAEAEAALRAVEDRKFEEARRVGVHAHTDSEFSAAQYWGLTLAQCSVFRGPSGGDGFLYAVVPNPGFEAVSEHERERQRRCTKARADRHKVFPRIRKKFGLLM